MNVRPLAIALPLALAFSCKSDGEPVDSGIPTEPPVEEQARTCDAGDEAWVQRVIPLMWGRRAHGSAEVRAWAGMVAQHGREAVVRAMADDPQFALWWRQWVTDKLAVARTGDKEYSACFAGPLRDTHDGSLTQWIRSIDEPWGAGTPDDGTFNMADVIADALVADDLAVAWQVNLFARMNRPVQGANVSIEELEYNRRVNFGEVFFESYLNRNLDCVLCHNSTVSVTDHPDARFDRTWQLPGRHETAILGSNANFSKDEAFAIFRTEDVVRTDGGGRRPYGINDACGRFRGPNGVSGPDFIGQDDTFLVYSYGGEGSVWQLERNLAEGADRLSTDGLQFDEDENTDGRDSLAYLMGARITDLVFAQATGARLTVAHGFPRNLDQASRLESLTDAFVENGFSLRELLVHITADELFNPGLPAECVDPADPGQPLDVATYGLPPVANPWSIEDDIEERKRNSPGDLVQRLTARVLLNSANSHLGWGPPRAWDLSDNEEEFQASVGVFLRESQPGFNGVDFQGLLAVHDRYAVCARNQGNDWITSLIDAAGPEHTTEDLVVTMKDRLLTNGALQDAERPLLEALVGPLSAPAEDVVGNDLRAVCGAILTSPPYMLAIAPSGIGEPPPLLDQTDAACESAIEALTAAGYESDDCSVPDEAPEPAPSE